jgi:hypothetical protein
MIYWLHFFGTVMKQSIIAERYGGAELLCTRKRLGKFLLQRHITSDLLSSSKPYFLLAH